jgi:hypothetical protein
MGFELKKLMRQSGVSTPGVVNYSGPAAPVIPTAPTGERPAGEDAAAKAAQTAYDNQLTAANAYKTDPSAFNNMARKYNLAQKEYDQYRDAYTGRLQNTPMYQDAQYQTGPSAGMAYATREGGIGADKYNQNIRDWVAKNPAATPQDFRAEMDKYGVSGYDAAQARSGSMWGGALSAPTYGAVPLSLGSKTQQEKIDYYNNLRTLGYTDADIRGAAESSFGKLPDADWNVLSGKNNSAVSSVPATTLPTYNGLDSININNGVAGVNTGTGWIGGTGGGNLGGVNVLNRAHGGSVEDLEQKYAEGGQVKTHYKTAGAVKLSSGYGSEEEEADFAQRFFQPAAGVEVTPVNMDSPPPPMITQLPERAAPSSPPAVNEMPEAAAPLTRVALDTIKASSEPVAPAAAPVAPAKSPAAMPDRMAGIQSLLAAYGPKESAYGEDLKTARAAAKAESDAFAEMLNKAMKSPEDEKASKAEIYFRLAAAFGAPTKTGQFSENLGMVGKELGEYSKGKRASAQQKLALGLEAQKLKMGAAKEDLRSLQALTGEEMKDKRAIATELIKDYIKSGEPQSTAGKQALDEGLKPGTPEYQKRVGEIGNLNVEGKMAQISATLQNLSLSQANFLLNQDKFANQKAQQSKLTGPELKLKTEAEDLIASSKQSLDDLKKAYALNPNSLAGGWLDKGQQFLGEAAGSKDPTIVNTRILNNLLGSQGLAKLKATFGGAPTEGERAILMELEGIGSKTKEERGAIIKRAYKVLQDRVAREQTRLDQITSGAYRTTTPLEGGTD